MEQEEIKQEEKKQEEVRRNEGKQSKLGEIADLLYAPTRFFERNEEKSRFIIPMLLLLISTVLLTMVSVPITMNSEEVMSQLGDQMNSQTLGTIVMITGTIGATIGGVISMLLTPLIILLCIKYILKGETTYRKLLAVYVYSQIPQVLLNIICAIVYTMTGHISTNLLTTLVLAINPITIWSLILLIIGTHVVSKVSIKKCAILFVAFEVISLGISVGTSFM